jgi:hypothetical protein
MFLTDEELVRLTGRKMKSKQIEALRKMAIPFFVNALGQPIVARAQFEPGQKNSTAEAPRKAWVPRVLLVGESNS